MIIIIVIIKIILKPIITQTMINCLIAKIWHAQSTKDLAWFSLADSDDALNWRSMKMHIKTQPPYDISNDPLHLLQSFPCQADLATSLPPWGTTTGTKRLGPLRRRACPTAQAEMRAPKKWASGWTWPPETVSHGTFQLPTGTHLVQYSLGISLPGKQHITWIYLFIAVMLSIFVEKTCLTRDDW